eukprot:3944307-Alexandrium_andersonii.AAC.1
MTLRSGGNHTSRRTRPTCPRWGAFGLWPLRLCVCAWNRYRVDQLSRWVSPCVPACMASGFAGRTVEK